MVAMYIAWAVVKNIFANKQEPETSGDHALEFGSESTPLISVNTRGRATGQTNMFDIVDIHTVDLYADEHVEDSEDELDNEEMKRNLQGRFGWLWRLYYIVA